MGMRTPSWQGCARLKRAETEQNSLPLTLRLNHPFMSERDIVTGTCYPSEDIDLTHVVDTLRIERMSENSVWIGGYAEDNSEECKFWLSVDDGGLKVGYEVDESKTPVEGNHLREEE